VGAICFDKSQMIWPHPRFNSVCLLCFWYLLRLISWPLIKKGKTDNTTEVFVCVMNRCWVFSFKKWFFFRRGCACASVSLLSTRLRVWSSFLFPLSLVFIRVQFRFFFNRSSCVCVCRNCFATLSIFKPKSRPFNSLLFTIWPTDFVSFRRCFVFDELLRSGVSTGYPPVFRTWTECEIK
jgi:hypothetical protein